MADSKYKGIHQRKNGSWYYRIKKKDDFGKEHYFQESGFDTAEKAYRARLSKLQEIDCYNKGLEYRDYHKDLANGIETEPGIDLGENRGEHFFGDVFEEFLEIGVVGSDSSIKKYRALYNAQLSHWEAVDITDITRADIDFQLLRLALGPKHYKESYISSIRKLLNLVFRYASRVGYISENPLTGITAAKYKLRVLSLFSGIGAPEQAMKNLGLDYELVNFCEIDKKAAKAYCLLHNVNPSKNLVDVVDTAYALSDPGRTTEKIMRDRFGLPQIDYEKEKIFMGEMPNFDILYFGFPCTDISSSGNQKGFKNEDGSLTRSGLFFMAMQIAYVKKPKILLAENVAALVSAKFENEFRRVIEEFEDCGYQHYHTVLNSADFGVPQHRKRTFMLMIREDLKIDFKWPEPIPQPQAPAGAEREWASSYFHSSVADEYYATNSQIALLNRCETHKPNYKRDIISCITTGWGTTSYTKQTFIKDSKGIRCLSSEELMHFQGFEEWQGTMLRENGFSKNQVGKMVGNSITVDVIQAVIKQIIAGL